MWTLLNLQPAAPLLPLKFTPHNFVLYEEEIASWDALGNPLGNVPGKSTGDDSHSKTPPTYLCVPSCARVTVSSHSVWHNFTYSGTNPLLNNSVLWVACGRCASLITWHGGQIVSQGGADRHSASQKHRVTDKPSRMTWNGRWTRTTTIQGKECLLWELWYDLRCHRNLRGGGKRRRMKALFIQ